MIFFFSFYGIFFSSNSVDRKVGVLNGSTTVNLTFLSTLHDFNNQSLFQRMKIAKKKMYAFVLANEEEDFQ
jgi:hypothetical protein